MMSSIAPNGFYYSHSKINKEKSKRFNLTCIINQNNKYLLLVLLPSKNYLKMS